MRLVKNWRGIVAKSHSMWAVYIGLLLLVAPEVLFYGFGAETNPIVIWFGAGGALVWGGIGRIKDQGLSE